MSYFGCANAHVKGVVRLRACLSLNLPASARVIRHVSMLRVTLAAWVLSDLWLLGLDLCMFLSSVLLWHGEMIHRALMSHAVPFRAHSRIQPARNPSGPFQDIPLVRAEEKGHAVHAQEQGALGIRRACRGDIPRVGHFPA